VFEIEGELREDSTMEGDRGEVFEYVGGHLAT
jgi:hypothetical protein